ncbi:MAG: TonB-dependent receptor [Bacteroidales bacterium]|nr:TonB-dependent receptor [Bacteroidales bacterium]
MLLIIVFFTSANKIYCIASEIQQNEVQIEGTVTDAKTGEPLPGVSILIKGTSTGTITDIDGKYQISAPPNSFLVFSFMGYIDKEVQINNETVINISLDEDIIGLDEVVVVGYGVQKKSDLTGSVASVSSEKLNSVPIPSVEHALQGMASGVNIITKSGRPGENADIQIRGISSINGTRPLVIIDGVYGDLNQLNPNDIASIEVLKDASSAAIYGATGGNGVILVTTKNGKSGKMQVSANIYRGIENPVKTVDVMNSQQYLELVEELTIDKSDVAITSRPDTFPTYNWQDMCFQQTVSENYDISISGGNEVSTFLASTSLNKQNGLVKNTDYQRYTIRINSDHKVNKFLTFDEKVTYVHSETDGFDNWYWHNYYNDPIVGIIAADPTIPAYDENGVWTISDRNVSNPMVALDMKDKVNKDNNFTGNFGAKINLFKGFEYQSRITGKLAINDQKEYEAIYRASPTQYRDQDRLIQSMKKDMYYNFQNFISYQTTIAQSHNILVMAGMEASKWWWNDISGERVDMANPNPNLLYLSKSTNGEDDRQNVKGTADNGTSQAYFGRLNYDFKGRYLLTFNIRRDGSSNFGLKYRWGTFPSFSVGWKFSEENFMNNVPFISTGKIRFGYGQTGANAKNGFPYLPLVVTRSEFRYTVDGQTTQVGTAPNQIANPDLHWESVNMSNIGLDMTFFDNRISLTADWFNKINDGMILEQKTSYIAGTFNGEMPEVNIGSISNKGFEISLGASKKEGELTGSFDLNFSHVENKVLELATDSMQRGAVHTVNPTNMTLEGYPIAQFYGYQLEGMFSEDDPTITDGKRTIIINQPFSINPTTGDTLWAQRDARPGDARFKDVDGNGKINSSDRILLGSPLPTFTFGFTINLLYKGFDFTAFFNGDVGKKIMNGTKQYLYEPVGFGNRSADFANRYTDEIVKTDPVTGEDVVVVKENHNTDIYRTSSYTYAGKMTSFYVEDGSYLRLRNVTLGYTLPNALTNRIGIEKLRLYAGGKNLFTLTKYSGLNPEVAGLDGSETDQILTYGVDIGLYPVTKMFYFGVNLVF